MIKIITEGKKLAAKNQGTKPRPKAQNAAKKKPAAKKRAVSKPAAPKTKTYTRSPENQNLFKNSQKKLIQKTHSQIKLRI